MSFFPEKISITNQIITEFHQIKCEIIDDGTNVYSLYGFVNFVNGRKLNDNYSKKWFLKVLTLWQTYMMNNDKNNGIKIPDYLQQLHKFSDIHNIYIPICKLSQMLDIIDLFKNTVSDIYLNLVYIAINSVKLDTEKFDDIQYISPIITPVKKRKFNKMFAKKPIKDKDETFSSQAFTSTPILVNDDDNNETNTSTLNFSELYSDFHINDYTPSNSGSNSNNLVVFRKNKDDWEYDDNNKKIEQIYKHYIIINPDMNNIKKMFNNKQSILKTIKNCNNVKKTLEGLQTQPFVNLWYDNNYCIKNENELLMYINNKIKS